MKHTTHIHDITHKILGASGDRNYCALLTTYILTGVNYEKVQQMYADWGRKKGKCSTMGQITNVLKELGYSYHNIMAYNKPKLAVKNLLKLNLPMREDGLYMIKSGSHLCAATGTEVHDFVSALNKRIQEVYELRELN